MRQQVSLPKMAGLSLIELLVSMTIGLFLIGGLVNVYISTKGSDNIRSEVTAMEESARIALSSIRQIVSHAGYPSMRNLHIDAPFYAETDDIPNTECRGGSESLISSASASINILNKKTKRIGGVNGAKRDAMVVVSIADSPNAPPAGQIISDCMEGEIPLACSSDEEAGMYNPSDAKLYSYLYINNNRSLLCKGSRGGTQPLVENIENMQFLYGIVDNDGNYQYRNAEAITANSQWGLVVSVQVAILVRSEKEVLEKSEAKTFVLLDEDISISADKRLYRVYTTSIVLPNRAIREL